MTRLLFAFTLFAAVSAPIYARPQQSQDQPQSVPITGRVVNDATGDSIAGAIVHYRGLGLSFKDTDLKVPYDPPSIQGEVTTGADGAYTTPPLPAFGSFMVRASAPGFLAAQQSLQALPENLHDSAPPGFPAPPNGTVRLRPDPLGLTPMSDAALAVFALPHPGVVNREYRASAFSSDGNRLAFLTFDTFSPPLVDDVVQPPFQRCVAWIYTLKSRVVTAIDEHKEQHVCESTAIAWDGDIFYTNSFPYPNPQTGSPLVTERVHANEVIVLPLTALPKAIQDQFEHNAAQTAKAQSLILARGAITPDGHYSIAVDTKGRSICGSLTVTNLQTLRKHSLGEACIEATFLTLGGDLALYNDARMERNGRANRIVEYDLKSGASRSFDLPGTDSAAELMTSQPLASGAIRIAYSIDGDCDPASSDYSQPFQPEGVLGPTPNQSSVCFITIPPPARSARMARK